MKVCIRAFIFIFAMSVGIAQSPSAYADMCAATLSMLGNTEETEAGISKADVEEFQELRKRIPYIKFVAALAWTQADPSKAAPYRALLEQLFNQTGLSTEALDKELAFKKTKDVIDLKDPNVKDVHDFLNGLLKKGASASTETVPAAVNVEAPPPPTPVNNEAPPQGPQIPRAPVNLDAKEVREKTLRALGDLEAPQNSPRGVLQPSEKMKEAAANFRSFFRAIERVILERDYLVKLAELALIAREHLWMIGPGGTAKSKVATTIMSNIVDDHDRPSFFRLQMNPETGMAETHGPFDFKLLQERGVYERLTEEGMLSARNVFLDEFTDARPNTLRNILTAIHERIHSSGSKTFKGIIESVFVASNDSLNAIYVKSGENKPRALLDRFAFLAWVSPELEGLNANLAVLRGETNHFDKKLKFSDLNLIRDLTEKVEISDEVGFFITTLFYKMKYRAEKMEQNSLDNNIEREAAGEPPEIVRRATKQYSIRTLGKSGQILKALVVRRWLANPSTHPDMADAHQIEANLDDVKALKEFFTLAGPNDTYLAIQARRSIKPDEKHEINTIETERDFFDTEFNSLLRGVNSGKLAEVEAQLQKLKSNDLSENEKVEIESFLAKAVEEGNSLRKDLITRAQIDIDGKFLSALFAARKARDALVKMVKDESKPASSP